MRALLIAAALLLLVPATAAAADVVIDGRGWGHGVGLSQYGVYGFALREERGYRFRALDADRVSVIDATTGRTRARLRVPVTVTGGSSMVLHGSAKNSLRDGVYRGRMVLSRE